jgi:hypothetical protein
MLPTRLIGRKSFREMAPGALGISEMNEAFRLFSNQPLRVLLLCFEVVSGLKVIWISQFWFLWVMWTMWMVWPAFEVVGLPLCP